MLAQPACPSDTLLSAAEQRPFCVLRHDGYDRLIQLNARHATTDNATEIRALEADAGSHLGYVRVVGRRRADAQLMEPVVSVPMQYVKKPLLRGEA